jgi:hypothetical protein
LYQAHYGHHDFPTNHKLFFVPIWVALPVLGVNFGLIWAIAALLGVPAAFHIATAIALVGGVLMFMGYEWFHMTSHLNVPKTKIERRSLSSTISTTFAIFQSGFTSALVER